MNFSAFVHRPFFSIQFLPFNLNILHVLLLSRALYAFPRESIKRTGTDQYIVAEQKKKTSTHTHLPLDPMVIKPSSLVCLLQFSKKAEHNVPAGDNTALCQRIHSSELSHTHVTLAEHSLTLVHSPNTPLIILTV